MANELESVKPKKVTLKIHGKEREIKFSFSAWAKIEELYGGMNNIDKLREELLAKPFNTMPKLLYIGLVDKEGVTEDDILDDYELSDIGIIKDVFEQALFGSLPQDLQGNEEKEAKA